MAVKPHTIGMQVKRLIAHPMQTELDHLKLLLESRTLGLFLKKMTTGGEITTHTT